MKVTCTVYQNTAVNSSTKFKHGLQHNRNKAKTVVNIYIQTTIYNLTDTHSNALNNTLPHTFTHIVIHQ